MKACPTPILKASQKAPRAQTNPISPPNPNNRQPLPRRKTNPIPIPNQTTPRPATPSPNPLHWKPLRRPLNQPRQLHNPPALFSILVLPYAFTSSVTVILMPYLLRKYNLSVDEIANIVVVASLPSIWSFLWSPLADIGMRKRSWVILSATGAGLASLAAILNVTGSSGGSHALMTALLFLMNAFAGLLSSSCGALLTDMPAELRGRSSGFYQAGNTGGAAIGGGLFIWLADHASLPSVALMITALMIVPALAALVINERPPHGRALGPHFADMGRDMKDLFRSRYTWIGLIFLLSPVGSAAVGNLISGMGPDYHASGEVVLWASGVAGGLLSAFGCFLGGFIADKIGRMMSYALAGGLAAVCALYMAFAPATSMTYAVGYGCYAVSAGIAYAVFTAMVLDILGHRKHAAASGYAVLNSAGNLPIEYMTWLDGMGYGKWGARGLMTVDAAANGGFGIVLLVIALFRFASRAKGRNSSGCWRTYAITRCRFCGPRSPVSPHRPQFRISGLYLHDAIEDRHPALLRRLNAQPQIGTQLRIRLPAQCRAQQLLLRLGRNRNTGA